MRGRSPRTARWSRDRPPLMPQLASRARCAAVNRRFRTEGCRGQQGPQNDPLPSKAYSAAKVTVKDADRRSDVRAELPKNSSGAKHLGTRSHYIVDQHDPPSSDWVAFNLSEGAVGLAFPTQEGRRNARCR